MQILFVCLPNIFCEGLGRLLLEEDPKTRFDAVANIADATSKLNFNRYDLVVFNLGNPVSTHLEHVKLLSSRMAACPVIVLADCESPELLRKLKEHGASGFISKSEPMETFWKVIRAVRARPKAVTNTSIAAATDYIPSPRSFPRLANTSQQCVSPRPKPEMLTPRQMQVLRSLAKGNPNKLIARELDVSENTVKAHLKAVFRILGASNRTEAVTQATRMRLVTD